MKSFYIFCAFYFICVPLGYVYFVWPMHFTCPLAFYTLSFIALAFTAMMAFFFILCVCADIEDMRDNKEEKIVTRVKERLRSFILLMSKRDDIITFVSDGDLNGKLITFYARSSKYSVKYDYCGFSVSTGIDSSSNELKLEWYDFRTNAENIQLYDFLAILDYLINVAFISDCGIEKVSFDGATRKIVDVCSVLEPVRYVLCKDNKYSLIWERESWDTDNSVTIESNKQLYDVPTIPHMEAINAAYPSVEAVELQVSENIVK